MMGALFLSDLHLGSPICKADRLLAFLARQHNSHGSIYLLGDVFDDVMLSRWPATHIKVVEYLASYTVAGLARKLVWLPGNHDSAMRALVGVMAPNLVIQDEGFYIASNGKRYFLTHGDRYDWTMRYCVPLSVRRWLKPSHSSGLHGRLFGAHIEKSIIKATAALGFDGVICGHTHVAAHRLSDGVEYVNCGDWTNSCTAVTDDGDGIRLMQT
jgi:UDP-2,3-diacylglucosamine pyrophosphatase LpxH